MAATEGSSPGIRVLCPTRWTVRADSLASITKNYTVLQSTWEEDSKTKACSQEWHHKCILLSFYLALC